MSEQTRIAVLAEYRDARAKGDYDRALEIGLAAMDIDAKDPGGIRLMDELRGLHQLAAA
ncbi:hypothetical protein ACFTXJ_14465 [Streptomyces zhihengii]|jgi:hypothetical protein|uniref:hypothetical protein n=1 Tax=Streptomyces zhihengii TaxID=1818004 RepID=UPI003630C7FD